MKFLSKIVDWISFPYGLFLLLKKPGIPGLVKLKAGLTIVAMFIYFINPADIIPDIIPVLGWVEDLLAIPIAMSITKKTIPEIDVPALIDKAHSNVKPVIFWAALVGILMALISLAALVVLYYFAFKYWAQS